MIKQETVYEMRLVSALEKVFLDERPVYRPECMKLTALKGETVSFYEEPGEGEDRVTD